MAGYFDGVLEFDGTQWRNHPKSGFGLSRANMVKDIAFDRAGALWVVTDSGVATYDGTSWKPFDETSGLSSRFTACITVDPAGRIWVGHDAGISMRDAGKMDQLWAVGARDRRHDAGACPGCGPGVRSQGMHVGAHVRERRLPVRRDQVEAIRARQFRPDRRKGHKDRL